MSVRNLLAAYKVNAPAANILYVGFDINSHADFAAYSCHYIVLYLNANNWLGIFNNGGVFSWFTFIGGSGSIYDRGPATSVDTSYSLEMKIDFGNDLVTPRVDGTPYSTFAYTVASMGNLYFGAFGESGTTDHDLDNLTVGTSTWGGTEIFSANFAGLTVVPPFDSDVGGAGLDASGGFLSVITTDTDAYGVKAISFP